MDGLYLSYLDLLGEVGATLERLSQLAQEKTAAVRRNDLTALDEVLKQEQAMTLNLRGLEQKRLKMDPQLGLEGTGLSALPQAYPEHLQDAARQTADTLGRTYAIYRAYADEARGTLELNLHQVEKVISAAGVDPKLAAAGYEAPNIEPPKNMKTDFRA